MRKLVWVCLVLYLIGWLSFWISDLQSSKGGWNTYDGMILGFAAVLTIAIAIITCLIWLIHGAFSAPLEAVEHARQSLKASSILFVSSIACLVAFSVLVLFYHVTTFANPLYLFICVSAGIFCIGALINTVILSISKMRLSRLQI